MVDNVSRFENDNDSLFDDKERPTLLKVLCILSWIGSGIQILTSTIYSMYVDQTVKQEIIALLPNDDMKAMYQKVFDLMDNTSIWYLLLYLGNIGVVYLMWNFKKNGFYGYILIQILILFVPFLVTPFQISQLVTSSLFPMIFIFLYGINVKHLDS
jgi:hypothetical protein